MSESLKSFIAGAGSILELAPNVRESGVKRPAFMKSTDAQRLHSDWQRVGNHLARALNRTVKSGTSHGASK